MWWVRAVHSRQFECGCDDLPFLTIFRDWFWWWQQSVSSYATFYLHYCIVSSRALTPCLFCLSYESRCALRSVCRTCPALHNLFAWLIFIPSFPEWFGTDSIQKNLCSLLARSSNIMTRFNFINLHATLTVDFNTIGLTDLWCIY